MNWDRLRIFYHIANAGSFTYAAEKLNITQPALSRNIRCLEHTLKTKLLNRNPRGVTLTSEGMVWYETAKKVFLEIEGARALNIENRMEAQGSLNVSTTSGFASCWLIYFIPDFLKTHPNVQLSIIGSDHDLDLNAREADVAILPFGRSYPGFEERHLITYHQSLYASQEYLNEFGTPNNPEDLESHRLLTLGNIVPNHWSKIEWPLNIGKKRGQLHTPYMTANSSHSLLYLAQQGVGIISFAEESPLLKQSNLIKVLPKLESLAVDYYYIYPEQFDDCKRVTALYEYLKKNI